MNGEHDMRSIPGPVAEQVRRALSAEMAAERAAFARALSRAWLAGTIATALAAAMALLRGHVHFSPLDGAIAAGFAGLWVAGLVLVRTRPGLIRARRARAVGAFAVALLGAAFAAAASAGPFVNPEPGGRFLGAAASCFSGLAMVGGAALVLLAVAVGRMPNRMMGALLGLAAGALGMLVTNLTCPIGGGGHFLLGHALALAAAVGAGALWLPLPDPTYAE